MSPSPDSIADICKLSHLKRFTLPVQKIIDIILYDAFIVCLEMYEEHLKLAVFDRITSKQISALEVPVPSSKVWKLVRWHHWSVGFCTIGKVGTVENYETFLCFLHHFSINQVGQLEKLSPILLLSSPKFPDSVDVYTSLEKNNACVMVLSVNYWSDYGELEQEVYDISETKKFPVVSAPTLIIKEGVIRCLAGRTLWVENYKHHYADEIKQYDLTTGLIRTLKSKYSVPFKSTLFRNRFYVSLNMGKLRTVDISTGEDASIEGKFLPWERIESCDASDDGFMLFRTYSANIFTCRLDVPSLSDIAKEIIHKSDQLDSLEDEDDEEDSSEEEQEDEAPTDFNDEKDEEGGSVKEQEQDLCTYSDDEEDEEGSPDEEEEISSDSDADEPAIKRTRQSQAE